jgi:cytidylate kinase
VEVTPVKPAGPPERVPVVLAISRQLAAGGAYIGQSVARRLSLQYVDRDLLTRAAAALGVADEQAIEALEERVGGIWPGIARALFVGAPDTAFVPPPPPNVHEADVLAVETRIIRDIASTTDCVIVGRGAAHLLRDHAGVIRVFVHAPREMRIREAQRVYSLSEPDARQMVAQSDRNRAKFVQSIVGRLWSDACLYDLTVDTSVVPIDDAAAFITTIIEKRLEERSGSRS